jgi:hypothetical protein
VNAPGCFVCGEDALPGQRVRVADWFVDGSRHVHDDCYLSLHTDPRKRARNWPRLEALPVMVMPATRIEVIYVISPHRSTPAVFTDLRLAEAYAVLYSGEIVAPEQIDPEFRAEAHAALRDVGVES